MVERIKEVERIIIRKDMILTTILILSIIPFSLIMICIPIVASGFISNVSSAIMIFCLFIFGVLEFFSLVIVIVGTIELLELIFFGMKKFVIDKDGITSYRLWKKVILWQKVAEIQLHHEPFYFLIILEKNGKNMEINLASASLMISEQEIYQYCLKKWKIAQK